MLKDWYVCRPRRGGWVTNNCSVIFCKFMKKIYKRFPFLFYKPKSQENEALGPSKKLHTAAELQILNSKCSSQEMEDVHGDSSKTLMGKKSRLVSVVDPQHWLRFRQTLTTQLKSEAYITSVQISQIQICQGRKPLALSRRLHGTSPHMRFGLSHMH